MPSHQLSHSVQHNTDSPHVVKTEAEGASSAVNEEGLPCGAQHSLHQIHKHLVEISDLSSHLCDESAKHQTTYMSEHQKLLQSVAAHGVLTHQNEKQQQEIQYYKQELVPYLDRLLQSQRQEIYEAQTRAQSLEARAAELEKMSSAEIEKHTMAVATATNLLAAQEKKIKELEIRVTELSVHSRESPAQRTRSSRPTTRSQTCKQAVPEAHAV